MKCINTKKGVHLLFLPLNQIAEYVVGSHCDRNDADPTFRRRRNLIRNDADPTFWPLSYPMLEPTTLRTAQRKESRIVPSAVSLVCHGCYPLINIQTSPWITHSNVIVRMCNIYSVLWKIKNRKGICQYFILCECLWVYKTFHSLTVLKISFDNLTLMVLMNNLQYRLKSLPYRLWYNLELFLREKYARVFKGSFQIKFIDAIMLLTRYLFQKKQPRFTYEWTHNISLLQPTHSINNFIILYDVFG
jgi:hypothetical protein